MVWESGYLGAVGISSAIVLAGAIWLWSDELDVAGKVFSGILALYALTGALVLAQLFAPSQIMAATFYGLHTTTINLVTAGLFVFAVLYTGRRDWLSRPLVGLIGGWVLVFGALMVTNPLHGLVWSSYEVVGTSIAHIHGVPTPLFLVLANGAPLLYFGSLLVVLHRVLTASGVSRAQPLALFVGLFPPTVSLVLHLAGVLPGPLHGAFVIGSTWTFIFVGWAIYRYRLFDVVPLARETVFEELDDPIVVIDDELRVLDYNQVAVDTFPAIDNREGPRIVDLLPVADDGVDREPPLVRGFTHIGEDGPLEFTVDVSTLTVDDEVRGYTLVFRDVTERERHLRNLERQTEQLERFASTLSHDLRNPLNVAQARVKGAIQSGSTEKLEAADAALDRIDAMIQDLLALSREGRTIDETERVPLAGVFRDAWETTDTRDATLEVDPGADVVVYADGDRLQNVFENLIRNAVQHGGPDVTVTFGRHPNGFYVEDDGPGVPPDDRASVFEFDYTTHDEGTGLGLAIVDAIAQAHGWTVAMEGGRDGGAKVVFSGVDVVEKPDEPRSQQAGI